MMMMIYGWRVKWKEFINIGDDDDDDHEIRLES